MAKLPFALKEGHPLKGEVGNRDLKGNQWTEVDDGVWGMATPIRENFYGVVLLSRDCGIQYCASGSTVILLVIRDARRIREDQHEVDVARATGETP